jgi:hypothetical protein
LPYRHGLPAATAEWYFSILAAWTASAASSRHEYRYYDSI